MEPRPSAVGVPRSPVTKRASVKCRSTSKRTGKPCENFAIAGGLVCSSHGGSAPQVRARAAVRAEVMAWGLGDTTVDPSETLLRLISQSASRVRRYADELERLVEESPNLRDALVGDAYGEFGKTGEYVKGLALLEATERDRLAGFSAKAIAAGLMERQVKLAEHHGALIADVLRAVLNDPTLGLSEGQRALAPDVIRRHLALAPG